MLSTTPLIDRNRNGIITLTSVVVAKVVVMWGRLFCGDPVFKEGKHMSFADMTEEQKRRVNATQTRYRRDQTRRYSFRLFKSTDAELIEYIESIKGSRTEFFRELIRGAMRKQK